MTADPQAFKRVELLLGPEVLARIQRALVAVVGLGAVGSFAVEALVRSGVGHLRLVDFDVAHPSNLNRSLFALHSTIGKKKIEIARARLQDINPDCAIETLEVFVDQAAQAQVFAGPPDLIIDAIDGLSPKVDLIAGALQAGIPIVSSMGAARRTDPGMVRVGTLAEVQGCPLARDVRKRLRKRGHSPDTIPCVYSAELVGNLSRQALAPDDRDDPALRRGRERHAMGSLATLTGIFGLQLAHWALRFLAGDEWPGHNAIGCGKVGSPTCESC